MKRFLLLALSVLICSIYSTAQTNTSLKPDLIYKADNTKIECKIIEVTGMEIKYKKANYLDGPTYTIQKNEVVTIQYANGDSEVIKPTLSANNTPSPSESSQSSGSSKGNGYGAWGVAAHFTNGTHLGGVYDFMWNLGGQSVHYLGVELGGYYSFFSGASGGTLYVPLQYRYFPSTSNFYVDGNVGPRYTSLSSTSIYDYDQESLFTVSGGIGVGYVTSSGFDLSLRYHSYMGFGVSMTLSNLSR